MSENTQRTIELQESRIRQLETREDEQRVRMRVLERVAKAAQRAYRISGLYEEISRSALTPSEAQRAAMILSGVQCMPRSHTVEAVQIAKRNRQQARKEIEALQRELRVALVALIALGETAP
jgi:hypothetical protein